MLAWLAVFGATFVSEDLACLTTGVLIGQGAMSAPFGILACLAGIVVGDVGLWAVGRLLGPAVLSWRVVRDRVDQHRMDALREWVGRHAAAAIVTSRFVPGTRLPLYLASGFLGVPLRVFACWTTVGAALWTPAIVLLTAYTGVAVTALLPSGALRSILSVAAAVMLFAAVRYTVRHSTRRTTCF